MGFASCKARCVLISASLPKTPFPGERLCMLGWLCIVQSPCEYTPGVRAGAEFGAAALTKQGCLQSVAHSRCTTQRHQRLTTRIVATPQARTLWLLAKSFARCKTNKASNARHPIFINDGGLSISYYFFLGFFFGTGVIRSRISTAFAVSFLSSMSSI